jgi:hypothetical protein
MGNKKELLVAKSGDAISVTLNGTGLDLLELFAAAATGILKTKVPVEALHNIIDIVPYDGNADEIEKALSKALSIAKFKDDFNDDEDADDIDLGEGEVAVTKERMEELGRKILEERIKKVDDFTEHKGLDKDKSEMITLLKMNDVAVVMDTIAKLTEALFEQEDASDDRPS